MCGLFHWQLTATNYCGPRHKTPKLRQAVLDSGERAVRAMSRTFSRKSMTKDIEVRNALLRPMAHCSRMQMVTGLFVLQKPSAVRIAVQTSTLQRRASDLRSENVRLLNELGSTREELAKCRKLLEEALKRNRWLEEGKSNRTEDLVSYCPREL